MEARSKTEIFLTEMRLFAQLKQIGFEPQVIYDVGSAAGSWSYNVSSVFPQAAYEMFEPLADLAAYQSLLVLWLEQYPNFHLHPIGLGNENRDQQIMVCRDGFSSSFVDLGEHETIADRITVPMRRLDDYVAERGLPPPDIIKMDTQGTEGEIIDGGRSTIGSASVVQIESWLTRGYGPRTPLLHEIVEKMEGMGFILADFGDIYYHPDHRLVHVDAFFVRPDLRQRLNAPDGALWTL